MERIKKLAVITTHPIQYNAPLFKKLAEQKSFKIKVFYTWSQSKTKVFDPGFGKERSWDIPLLDGYEYTFVNNISPFPGSHHYTGIDNPTLIEEVVSWQADAVLIFGWSFKSHLHAMRYFKGKIPVLFRGDSNLLDEPAGFSSKKIVRRLFLTWVYRYIDYALYVGAANEAYYIKHKVSERKLVFAPHAIDNQRFSDNREMFEAKAKDSRNTMNIRDEDIVFLFAAKLIPKKSPDVLIEAFIALDMRNVHLIIVGNGKMENSLKEKYNNYPTLHFMNFQNQSQMPLVYRICNVFVLPSKGPGETWGLAVNEAMASNRPVIVSNKCGCAVDLVKEGINGLIYNTDKKDSLKITLQQMVDKKEHLTEMGNQSYKIIKIFNFSVICEAIENVLKKV